MLALPPVPHAEVNGQRLHYVRQGAGEPLLLIQGLSGNHLHWGDEFLGLLERDFEIVAYDHRGIGHSNRTGDPFTIVDLAQDAAALLDSLEIESAHVMGISMGGMVAQELALLHPDRVRTLTLGCTYAGGEGASLADPQVIQHLGELFLTGRKEEGLRAGFEYNVSRHFASDPENFELTKRIAAELPSSLNVMMLQVQAVAGHDTSGRLGEIAVPTLVMHGTDDQMIPVANARHIAERIPGARLEILEDVGHAFWWERPERAAELVRELAGAARATQ
jgi:pimeloyl-ACP methyl ester carboxylesterase